MNRMRELVDYLNEKSYQYYTLDNPTIADAEYDRLYDELVKLEAETGERLPDSPTRRVGGDVLPGFQPHTHLARLWSMGKAADVHEVVERYEEPRPAYTTVSTYMKILTTKGFVDYKKGTGKQYLYFPVISRAEYTSRVMRDVKDSFFGGSASSLLRFFVENEQIDEKEIRELLDLVNRQ